MLTWVGAPELEGHVQPLGAQGSQVHHKGTVRSRNERFTVVEGSPGLVTHRGGALPQIQGPLVTLDLTDLAEVGDQESQRLVGLVERAL